MYYEVVGGHNKKNIVYGLGSSQDLFYGPGNSSSAVSDYNSSLCNSQEDYEKLQSQMLEMKDQMKKAEEMRIKEVEEMNDQLKHANEMRMKEVDDMKDQIRQMQNQLAMVLENQK